MIFMENMWVIRAGKDTKNFNLYKKENFVSVGVDIGEIKNLSFDEIKFRLEGKVPNVSFTAGILRRFRDEVQIGDYFISTSPQSEYLLLGKILGDIEYDPSLIHTYQFTSYRRPVKWISKVYRKDLSVQARRSLSAQITVFKVKPQWQKEIFDNQVSLNPSPMDILNLSRQHEKNKEKGFAPSDNINSSTQYNNQEEYDFTKDKILFKYADLYKEGLITREEFEVKKKELL